MARIVGRLAAGVSRRPIAWLGVALLASLFALLGISRLQLETDPLAFFPRDAAAGRDFALFLETFGGVEQVFVLLLPGSEGSSPGPQELALAAEDLALRLEQRTSVASARSGIDPDDERFVLEEVLPRAALRAEGGAPLARALGPGAPEARVEAIRDALSGPAGPQLAPLFRADPLGLAPRLLDTAPGAGGVASISESGSFLAPSGGSALILVLPADAGLEPRLGRALLADLDACAAATRRELGISFELLAVGGALYAVQDEALLRGDLQVTMLGSLAVVTLIVILTFGGVSIPGAALLSIAVGLLWTGGLLGAALGEGLSAVSIGFASVLVGLGVDYAIHGSTRYRELRLAGQDAADATGRAIHDVGPGVLASAVTTALTFGVLSLAHFRPLREVGLVVALGIACLLVSTLFVGAALLATLGRRGRVRRAGWLWTRLGSVSEALARLGERAPFAVLVVGLVCALAGAYGALKLELDPDPRALRPASHPAQRAESILAESFGLALETGTAIVSADSLNAALLLADETRDALAQHLGPRARLQTASDWLPPSREGAPGPDLADIEDGRRRFLEAARQAGLSPSAFEPAFDGLVELARGERPVFPPSRTWPAWLRTLLEERDGRWYAAVQVSARAGSREAGALAGLAPVVESAAPGAAWASATRVSNELQVLGRGDLSALGGWALLALAGATLASFAGRPLPSLAALFPVLCGTAWTFGLWSLVDARIDLFSIVVLPVMLGIGVDDGLHAVHAARRAPGRSLGDGVRHAGRAIVLTSLTTACAFGGLVFAHVPGLRRGGLVVAGGCLLCLVATLVLLPALGELARRFRASRR